MNNRAKLLVSVLFIVVIVLCICLTRFYFDATKNTGNPDANAEIQNVVRTYGDMRVFESVNGFYGVLNSEDAVIIEPEWMEVLDITSDLVLVSRRMNHTVLIGGIDFEENVVLPFVFRSMTKLGDKYYAGVVEEDGSCLIYNNSFDPVFFRSYDDASYESGMLALETQKCIFSYYIADEQPLLRRAEMTCGIGDIPLQWRVGNQVYLSELSENDLLRINECVAAYMDMLLQSNFDGLPQISGGDYIIGLTKPNSFPENTVIDGVSNFSFRSAGQGSSIYWFSFTMDYHTSGSDTGLTVQCQISFRRNSENKMILTSAGLDFAGVPVTEETDAE